MHVNVRRALLATALVSLALPAPLSAAEGGTLTITVSGIRNTNGKLLACVWKDNTGFPTCQKNKSAIRQTVSITGATVTVRFTGLAPGTYAASAQHDEDGDGKLKTNFIGMPKEGIGISNNPGGMPSWGKSVIQIGPKSAIGISLKYL